jgi:hypothetical protein
MKNIPTFKQFLNERAIPLTNRYTKKDGNYSYEVYREESGAVKFHFNYSFQGAFATLSNSWDSSNDTSTVVYAKYMSGGVKSQGIKISERGLPDAINVMSENYRLNKDNKKEVEAFTKLWIESVKIFEDLRLGKIKNFKV